MSPRDGLKTRSIEVRVDLGNWETAHGTVLGGEEEHFHFRSKLLPGLAHIASLKCLHFLGLHVISAVDLHVLHIPQPYRRFRGKAELRIRLLCIFGTSKLASRSLLIPFGLLFLLQKGYTPLRRHARVEITRLRCRAVPCTAPAWQAPLPQALTLSFRGDYPGRISGLVAPEPVFGRQLLCGDVLGARQCHKKKTLEHKTRQNPNDFTQLDPLPRLWPQNLESRLHEKP